MHKILQPDSWKPPIGYANGVLAEGKQIYVAGQIGWTADSKMISSDLVDQVKQALQNIVDVLNEGDAQPAHVTRMTWFVTDKKEYLAKAKEIGQAYREVFGKHFPAMSLVQVADLLEDDAKVEIEATAVIPSE